MNLGNRYSQQRFSETPSVNTARSMFDRSHSVKTTLNFDELTPILIDEILPGDTVSLNTNMFARLATQVVPLMDNMYIDFFFFFVPNRLVWENWERFQGAQDNPGDSTDFIIPTLANAPLGFDIGSVFDQMGLPPLIPNTSGINALPFRGLNLIWNEWFRDQNLQQSIPVPKGDGPDSLSDYTLRKRNKMHDYFTSGLPWPQKGDPVTLPLGLTAPVVPTSVYNDRYMMVRTDDSTTPPQATLLKNASNANVQVGLNPADNGGLIWHQSGLETDLQNATSATINLIRQAFLVQSILELDARGGTRYVESLFSRWKVVSPDFRLQRPELLSTGRSHIQQHPVAQQSETGDTPQGNLAAFSTAAEFGSKVGFSKAFTEHGYIIGLACPRADVTYQQGLNKLWSRSTRFDFFEPKLQELGEQAILNKEIYFTGVEDDDNGVFSYAERWSDYRYKPSEIRSQFRSIFDESLDVWHLSEYFETAPQLNSQFITQNTPIERSLVIQEGYPHILLDLFFKQKHARIMTTHGSPATLGRF